MLKVSSLVCFVISVVLAAAYVGSRYFGFSIAYVTDLDRQSEITLAAAYLLLLVGIILESVAPKEKAEGSTGGQTILGTVGTSAAIVAAVFAVLTFWREQQRQVYATTLQLLVELEKSRPTNSRFCRCAAVELDADGIRALRARKPVALGERAKQLMTTCFADLKQDEAKSILSDASLTEAGATAFAGRLNIILGADENIAFAANNGIASSDMVVQEMVMSLAVDKVVVSKINTVLGTKLFPNIQKIDLTRYLKGSADNLCGPGGG